MSETIQFKARVALFIEQMGSGRTIAPGLKSTVKAIGKLRKWVSVDGCFEVEAKLVKAGTKEVVLQRGNRSVRTVSPSKLSAKDLEHLKTRQPRINHRILSSLAMRVVPFLLIFLVCACERETAASEKTTEPPVEESKGSPIFYVAGDLDKDGSLVGNYKRGLNYAIDYFGNHGPFHIYLLGPGDEESVREIFRKRAENRVDPKSPESPEEQIEEFLNRSNVIEEIEDTLAGESVGGLTWTPPPNRLYEDVTTNATGRLKDPIENTWGAMHEYHHVFQVAHCEAEKGRTSDRNFCSWMAEGMATYSSAKFMENLELVDFKGYMLSLRISGGNIGKPGINEYLTKDPACRLDDESYWDKGGSAQVYYMLGAWATAYLIHAKGIKEITVLKDWYYDLLPMGKSAAFEKHMKISLDEFYSEFDAFIRQSDDEVIKIFER
jgi:hypothetical protein